MNHPIISSGNGKARYNEMIQTADNYRRIKKLQLNNQARPSHLANLVRFLTSLIGKSKSDKTTELAARTS